MPRPLTWTITGITMLATLVLTACGGDDATARSGDGGTGGAGGGAGAGGAAGSGGSSASGGGNGDACPESHAATTTDGHDVTVCDALFEEPPYLRPPTDELPAAFAATDGTQLFLRGQAPRALASAELALMGLDSSDELRRSTVAVYRVALDAAGSVTGSVPAIVVQEVALFGFLAGRSAEGHISRHEADLENPASEYQQPPTLPIRLRFAEVTTRTPPDFDYDVVDQKQIRIVVENATSPVLASTGECFAALADTGTADPFAGTTAPELIGVRVPSMHAPGDNRFVIEGAVGINHMSSAWMVLPPALLASQPITLPVAEFSGHGNPLSMPGLAVAVVDGGGGACAP